MDLINCRYKTKVGYTFRGSIIENYKEIPLEITVSGFDMSLESAIGSAKGYCIGKNASIDVDSVVKTVDIERVIVS